MESDLRAERRGQLSRIEVSPLRGEALAESIAEPARAVGLRRPIVVTHSRCRFAHRRRRIPL